jgi:predicted nucleotidyltransferase
MLTRRDIETGLKAFVQSAELAGIPISRVWLFGSYARNKPHAHSDVDVAVFSPAFVENPFENTALIQPTIRIPQMQLHLHPMADLTNDPFVDHIRSEAIEFDLDTGKLRMHEVVAA